MGTLFNDLRRDARSGLLSAGIMCADFWLSERMHSWKAVESGTVDGGRSWLLFRFDVAPDGKHWRELKIEVDPDHGLYPVRTEFYLVEATDPLQPERKLRMESTALELVRWNDVWLPVKAEVRTHYRTTVHTIGDLRYESTEDGGWSVHDCPDEITRLNGAIQVWDELAREMLFHGDAQDCERLRRSYREDLTKRKRGEQQREQADADGRRRRDVATVWLAGAFGVVALLAWQRRRVAVLLGVAGSWAGIRRPA
jgi:hypothetical protein